MNIYTKIFLIIHRHKIYLGTALIFILIFYKLLSKTLNETYSHLSLGILSDPAKAGLLGAIVGGVLTLLGSMYIHKSELKAKGVIIRKDDIYTPLYEDLIKVRKQLALNEANYPYDFSFNSNSAFYRSLPKFEAWEHINGDVRAIEVPAYLRDGMLSMMNSGEKYLRTYKEASIKLRKLLYAELAKHEELEHLSAKKINDAGINYRIIDYLLRNERVPADLINEEIQGYADLSEGHRLLVDEIFDKFYDLKEISTIKKKYKSFFNQIDDLIKSLAKLIGFIQRKFEHRNWYY